MMKKTAKIIALTVGMFVFLAGPGLFAQTMDEAGQKFNEGIQMTKSDNFEGAIIAFEETIAICEQLGPEGAELQGRAEEQLPGLKYKQGIALYKAKKITESIEWLEKAVMDAEKYGDATTLARAKKVLPQLVNAVGLSYYKKDDLDLAIEKFDEAISYDPDFAKAYLGKALAYNKKDDTEAMREALRVAIEKGEADGDSKTVATAKTLGYKGFLVRGQKAIQANDHQKAQEYLSEAASYDEGDANLHYLLAVTYNKLSNWDDALAEAEKAVEMAESPEKTAAAYFEMGTAYEKKGDTENACSSYQKALTGPNGAAAKYQMEQVLKCQ